MEPSSTNISHNPCVDSHELGLIQPMHPDSPVTPENARGRKRVRLMSAADNTSPSVERIEAPNYSRVSENELLEKQADKTVADAEQLVRAHTEGITNHRNFSAAPLNDSESYAVTGNAQGGIFYHLMQAYKAPIPAFNDTQSEATSSSPPQRPGSSSGATTPSRRKWYQHEKMAQSQEKLAQSQETLATLVGASAKLANPNEKKDIGAVQRHHKRNSSGGLLAKVWKAKEDQDAKIKIHVANILQRQRYLIKMCRALMLFGAPTHRLEEYLAMAARVLEINSQFLYIPGCMIISFDDVLTHTAEVKIVRTAQGVNLGKLKDTHDVYKEVLHDVIDLDEALTRLDQIINAKDRHPVWLCILMYGLASTAVSCFFKARPIDLPIIFALGVLLGILQLVISPLSNTYNTVFEISATILISFLGRAFGSINGGSVFCFSAIVQSSIALILPGFVSATRTMILHERTANFYRWSSVPRWNCNLVQLCRVQSDSSLLLSIRSFLDMALLLVLLFTVQLTRTPRTKRRAGIQ